MRMKNFNWISVVVVVVVVVVVSPTTSFLFGKAESQQTQEMNELPHLKPHPDDPLELGAEGFDEKAFLGSEAKVQQFKELPREESMKRLASLAKKIDADDDGFVSKDELTKWLVRSIKSLKDEEATKRFADHDYDEDGSVSWDDHLYSIFGFVPTPEEIEKGVPGGEDSKEDSDYQIALFKAADVDGDKTLSGAEFKSFYRPEDFEHTRVVETERLLARHDADGDGGLDVEEFLKAELHEDDPEEWIEIERERFRRVFDVDSDGRLKGAEVVAWAMPSNEEVAREEVLHLFGVADDDRDDRLEVAEILQHHDSFVGSSATDFGKHLADEL